MVWRRALSRFGFAYWILFCSSVLPQNFGFGIVEKTIGHVWTELGLFVGRIIGVENPPTAMTGSGDRTIDYLTLLAILMLSMFLTGVWSGLDREGRHDERVRGAVRVVLRYTLALLMLSYGIAKMHSDWSQFAPPSVRKLTQRFGDSSPMGMLWTFMGSSQAYTKFAGISEILGGALLLSRRTTLAGALLLIPVMTNVVLMNFCYDVPVKINSSHYLVMAIVLALPDVRRIADVILFRRAVAAPPPLPVLRFRGRRAPVIAAKFVILAAFLIPTILARSARLDRTPMWFDGWWHVETFERNGVPVPAIVDDKTRWMRMKFETGAEHSYMRWHNMDSSMSTLYELTEQTNERLTFKDIEATGPNVTFALTRTDADHFELKTNELRVTLRRMHAEQTPLMTRGFHWINEVPYNR